MASASSGGFPFPTSNSTNISNSPHSPNSPNSPPSSFSSMDMAAMNKLAMDFGYFCPFRSVTSGVMGFGLGALMGLFLHSNPIGGPGSAGYAMIEAEQQLGFAKTAKQVFKELGRVAYSSGKSFAVVGAIFAGSECVIEGYRAKHDVWNSISAGCFTGGALAAKGGPQAMAMGCAGFAAFSAAIDYFFLHNSSDDNDENDIQ